MIGTSSEKVIAKARAGTSLLLLRPKQRFPIVSVKQKPNVSHYLNHG
jgi:hypothetical protein